VTALEHVQVVGLHQATTAEELLELIDSLRPAWHARAACRGMTDVMFPVGDVGHPPDIAAATAVCDRCPVRRECETAGRSETHGVWGGRRQRRNEWRGPIQRGVVEAMSDGQWWTAVSVGKWLSVTDVAARKALNRLRDLGVVEMTDSRPYRYRLREGS